MMHGATSIAEDAGIGAGVAGALLASRFLRHQMFGVGSFDLLTYAAVTLLLAVVWVREFNDLEMVDQTGIEPVTS
jgi:hypothetical protein